MKLPVGYVPGHGVVKATAYGGYGQRMLEKMGWEKGQGLGKSKHGIKQAIEVKKKEDQLGVGAQQTSWDWNWKYWEDAYNSAVQKVDHSSDSSSSSSDDDDDAPHVARKGKGKPVHNRDGTIATASAAELKLAAELAKDPWGRWGGRGGKMARIREQEAAEAAALRESLGLPPPAAVTRSSGEASTSSSSSDSSSDEEGAGKHSRKQKGGKAVKKSSAEGKKGRGKVADGDANGEAAPKKKPVVVVLKIKDENRKKFDFKPTPATGWWGDKYFISAGAMESLEEEAERQQQEEGKEATGKAQKRGFNEDDQAALYTLVHEHQRVGRKGLGQSTTLKIAGGKWEGTKRTFEEEDDGDKGVAAAAAAMAMSSDEEEEAAVGGKASKKEGKQKKGKRMVESSAVPEEDMGEEQPKKKKKKRAVKADAEEVAATNGVESESKKKEKKEKKKKKQDAEADEPTDVKASKASNKPAGGGEDLSGAASKQWLKVARKLLKKAPERRLKAKSLLQQLQEHASSLADGSAAPSSVHSLAQMCTNGCRLAVEGKYVVLQESSA